MSPGDKVVCVDTSPNRYSGNIPPLNNGAVYVVSSIGMAKYGPTLNVIGVSAKPHPGFNPNRFRLLIEMKQTNRNKTHALI